jgi:A/G-specific adenine glycosylase
VSEIMLQQTRVAAVIPYYESFLKRFPNVAALARARTDSVLALWSGLGYYRRARMLHVAAKEVAKRGFPKDAAGWRELPGVGEYTAAAVASIAFGERIAVVDGNVERVICRLTALLDRERKRIRSTAQAWLSARVPGDHNQAVMELGATICTPRRPACERCPVRGACGGRGAPERYPAPKRRPRVSVEQRPLAFCTSHGRVLLQRHTGPGLLHGLWDLPSARPRGEPLTRVTHSILDKRLILTVYRRRGRRGGSWFDARRAARLPLAGGARKCLKSLGFLK